MPLSSIEKFCFFYMQLIDAIDWNNRQIAQGRDVSIHLPRFKKLEAHVDSLWKQLNQEQKNAAFEQLINNGTLPERLRTILTLFEGKVIHV